MHVVRTADRFAGDGGGAAAYCFGHSDIQRCKTAAVKPNLPFQPLATLASSRQ